MEELENKADNEHHQTQLVTYHLPALTDLPDTAWI